MPLAVCSHWLQNIGISFVDATPEEPRFLVTSRPYADTARNDVMEVTLSLSFYKKEKSIYLILMTPINEETKMNESVLGEFINYDNFR